MQLFLLYLAMIVLGALAGSRFLKKEKEYRWIGNFQTIAIVVLVFTMGARIGSDERIFASIGEIGAAALLITLLTLAGSVAALFVMRKLLGFNRKGVREKEGNGG